MVPILKYTVLRLALFVAVLALLVVLHAGPLISIAGAALVSMMLAYLFLRRQRDEVTARIAERMEQRAALRPLSPVVGPSGLFPASSPLGRRRAGGPRPHRPPLPVITRRGRVDGGGRNQAARPIASRAA